MAVSRRSEGLTRAFSALVALCIAAAALPVAKADEPGRFDYWVLALSWSPQFCRSQPSSEQCEFDHGFVVHGLWPQYERGYPEYCGERQRVPKDLVERMRPLMPSAALINAQWRKHGTCSGLDMREYFLHVERAWRSVVIPERYRELGETERTRLRAIEDAFIALTPNLSSESIAVQCSGRWLREVRICLDRDFQPRACGSDVEDRCRSEVHVRPMRGRIVRQRP
ncbi:ribonuclease T2 [Sinimarinibacterium thermocellulolyticum]|uniref:Ribonuclease T2 n=1 Tax=Sinimarinibacterium thermocellulolyticum TaxID=3170016 RepID=A0ABV2A8Q8_9GAMM